MSFSKVVFSNTNGLLLSEFLPRILGPDLMKLYNLQLGSQGFFNHYDHKCDPSIYNEFATAAFRFGHSLIPKGYKLAGSGLTKFALNITDEGMNLRGHINNPDVVMGPKFVDELMEAIIREPMNEYDRAITDEVRNHLMEDFASEFSGVDLVALNIQRGRDHGLPGYTKYLEFCARDIQNRRNIRWPPVSKIRSFDQLVGLIKPDTIAKLQQVYEDVDDIDLFTGGLSEVSQSEHGLVGPTFGCIIAHQFEKLRQCDRFWYESPDFDIGFTLDQLKEIKKVTLASLICDNLDDENIKLQRNAFDLPDEITNPLVSCDKHSKFNMAAWLQDGQAQRHFCHINGLMITPGQNLTIGACTTCTCHVSNERPSCSTIAGKTCQKFIDEMGPEAVMADQTCRPICDRSF